MPKRDPQIDAHLEWIGFVRPPGAEEGDRANRLPGAGRGAFAALGPGRRGLH